MKKVLLLLLILSCVFTLFSCVVITMDGINTNALGYVLEPDGKSYAVAGFFAFQNFGDIVIPDTHKDLPVTKIDDAAFRGQEEIKRVTIPASVKYIGDNAFYGCTSLELIYFEGTEAQWNAIIKGTDWDKKTGNYKVYINVSTTTTPMSTAN